MFRILHPHFINYFETQKGVVITTFVQRTKGKKPPLKAPTKPAQQVKRLCNNSFAITIVEGRNRQIRKMCQALDFTVQKLHRTHFMGIALPPLQHQGEWSLLSDTEMSTVKMVLELAGE
jgi:23S rRNA pseudouridine2604 synthase